MKKFKFLCAIFALATAIPSATFALTPTVMTETWALRTGTSINSSYDIPDGGSDKLIVLFIYKNTPNLPTITIGGQSITTRVLTGSGGALGGHWVGYIATSSNGVPAIVMSACGDGDTCSVFPFTLQDVDTVSPIDSTRFVNPGSGTTPSVSTTTITGNTLLVGSVNMSSDPSSISWTSSGAVGMLTHVGDSAGNPLWDTSFAYQPAGSSPALETMSAMLGSAKNPDTQMVAFKLASGVGGGSSSDVATSSDEKFEFWDHTYFGLTTVFILSLISTILIWRRF